MAKEVIMPKVDMDQETGTVVEWRKQNGEHVNAGEVILVIETDKVAVDVESPGTGILQGISVGPGDVVPIGTVIAYLMAEGEDLTQGQKPASKPDQKSPISKNEVAYQQAATPLAKNIAAAHGLDLNTIIPSGKGLRVTKADVEAKLLGESSEKTEGKVYASPAARRAARESQVDLKSVQGSGPKGRIQTHDVLAFLEQRDLKELPVETQVVETKVDQAEVIPLIGMRRTIAERMTANYQNIPHIKFTSRVIMSEFASARDKLNELAKRSDEQKISATAMFVKLVASTLARNPFLNSSLKNDEIILHRDINIGVAVALENGLIVPVVKNADRKGFSEIAAEVNDLSTRARAGKLINADVKGGTFTISNLGPFGIEQFDAIINAPEAAILAVGATQLEAIPSDDGTIRSLPVMRMTLSVDHRIVDGAVAARFMADLKTILEAPILIAY
jgi:pyruvate dehydrogenase E2 component (dihydrolipoamide acetyltransferase)